VLSFAAQSILQTFVAALIIEALLWAWRIASPRFALALRSLVLLVALVVVPAFVWLAPMRDADAFTERWALFYRGHWSDIHAGALPIGGWLLGVSVALGLALYLADFIPFLVQRISARADPGPTATSGSIARDVALAAAAMGISPPPTTLSDAQFPLLFCTGLRPALVVSQAARDALDDHEWIAALSHELAHARFRDPACGWALMLARTAMCFNPIVQVVARAMVRNMERAADVAAVAATRDPAAMGRAIRKLASPWHGDPARADAASGGLAALLERARGHAAASRSAALAAHPYPVATSFAGLRLALAAVALPLLLFFVV
jgi:Zn-dependent protease with chaperone function